MSLIVRTQPQTVISAPEKPSAPAYMPEIFCLFIKLHPLL